MSTDAKERSGFPALAARRDVGLGEGRAEIPQFQREPPGDHEAQRVRAEKNIGVFPIVRSKTLKTVLAGRAFRRCRLRKPGRRDYVRVKTFKPWMG